MHYADAGDIVPESKTTPPVVITVKEKLWLPLKSGGSGFFGGAYWSTPIAYMNWKRTTFQGTNAIQVIELDAKDKDGKLATYKMSFDVALTNARGQIKLWYEDPFGKGTYSGSGEIRSYLKQSKESDTKISNVIAVPIAVDDEAKKALEKTLGPPPK